MLPIEILNSNLNYNTQHAYINRLVIHLYDIYSGYIDVN